MASGYTTNYGLCQWQRSDQFLREEFNQDNQRIDAVLDQVEGLAEVASHNVYNLLLRDYYEGLDTGWKKALVFDGFQSDAMTASKTTGLLRIQDRLALTRVGQGDVELGYGSIYSLKDGQTSRTITATGAGNIVGIHFKTNMIGSEAVSVKIACTVYVNGVQSRYETHSVLCPLGDAEQTITFSSVLVSTGDTFSINLATTESCFAYAGESGGLGGTVLITPVTAETGSLTTPALDLPDRTLLRGWLRYSGGSVGLSVIAENGTVTPFSILERRNTVNLQQEPCTELSFRLDEGFSTSEKLAFRLDLTLGDDAAMSVFDYGIILG